MANLENLRKMVANFPSRSSDVRFQQQIYNEIFGILDNLNKEIADLRKEIEVLGEKNE